MSRMINPDLWTEPPGTYAAQIAAGLAKLGISFDAGRGTVSPPPAPTKDEAERTTERLADLAARDGFLRRPDGGLISPTLAKQLHYVERPPAPAAGPAIDETPGELDSLEGMRRE